MDVFDQATELERLDREAALSRARAALDQGGPDWIDGVAANAVSPSPRSVWRPCPASACAAPARKNAKADASIF